MREKPLAWLGSSLDDVRAFPVDARREHRVFYVAKFEDAVYVLHAFEKHTRATPSGAIEMARRRLADLLHRRAR